MASKKELGDICLPSSHPWRCKILPERWFIAAVVCLSPPGGEPCPQQLITGCGNSIGKNNQAVSHLLHRSACLRRSRLPLPHWNYSFCISLFNKYAVLPKLPTEGGRRAAGSYLGIRGSLVKSTCLWGAIPWGERGLRAALCGGEGCWLPPGAPATASTCFWKPILGFWCGVGVLQS